MPITIKDIRPEAQPVRRDTASLVGGMVIAIGCFVLWLLVANQLMQGMISAPVIIAGAIVATVIGIWIRLADL
jgi:hypothetical protein